MFKKTISIVLVFITLLSALNIMTVTISADVINESATIDEATPDEAKIVIYDKPNVLPDFANGMAIGYIGDVNHDEKINVKDATSIQKYIARHTILNAKAKLLADTDNNDKLNIRDVTAIQKYIAGFEIQSVVWHYVYESGTHYHSYEEEVVEPKCEVYGYTLISCICGEARQENIVKAKGHTYEKKFVNPTCVEQGYRLVYCKNCSHSYKDNYRPVTEDHKYSNANICTICGADKPKFLILKEFLINKGKYDEDTSSYYYNLDTGYDVDKGSVFYDELDDDINICYELKTEGVLSTSQVVVYPKDDRFSAYVSHPKYFNGSTHYNYMYKWTLESDYLIGFSVAYKGDEIPKEECMLYSVIMIDAALAVYQHNEDMLPVTLADLGFTKFDFES